MIAPTDTVASFRPKLRWSLEALVGGVLLGLAFPPSPFFTLAYVAFLPLLHVLERADTAGRALRRSYAFVLAFHLVTVYWTGGFTVGRDGWMMAAGALLLFVHPLFYLPSTMLAWLVMRRRGTWWGVGAFVALWTAFEYVHSLGEFSFPWITVGNSQAYDLARAQVAEYVSVLGLTVLVLAFNGIAYVVLTRIAQGRWTARSARLQGALGFLVLIYVLPLAWGRARMHQEEAMTGAGVRVGIVQPNIDPWEKWGTDAAARAASDDRQLARHLDDARVLAATAPDLIVWPETAIPFYVLQPRHMAELRSVLSFVDSTRVPLLTGLPTARYFPTSSAPVTSQPIPGSDLAVESYNSVVLFTSPDHIGPVYRKMVLVPFAERIPYAQAFRFLIEPLRWNVGISSWGMGQDTVVYAMRTAAGDSARFAALICYESVYPDFVRAFVRRGAEFLVVVTNDSWWGNTSGAYQHAAYASLRSIETRRWLVQCANGGISLIVDPAGVVRTSTALYTEARFTATIARNTEETFYVRHGDLIGPVSLCCSLLFVMFSLIPTKRKFTT